MPQLVTLQQACRNALAAWLVGQLPDDVVIEPRWFEVGRELPPKSISIIDAGPRKVEWTDPELLARADGDEPGQTVGTWGLGYIEQRVQLDVWAQSDVELDDIMARLDVSLNAGHRALGGTSTNVDPCGVGVLLSLEDGWEPGTVDFTFDEPDREQTADAANQAEWHATYRGVANARLVQKATSPKMARIQLGMRTGLGDVNTDAAANVTMTIDADTPADA